MRNLRYQRKRRGLTLDTTAGAVGVSSSDLGKIERGQYIPPFGSTVLARLARFFDTPVDQLLEFVEITPGVTSTTPTAVPAIQPIDEGPTARQLQARRRCATETAEAADRAETESEAMKR